MKTNRRPRKPSDDAGKKDSKKSFTGGAGRRSSSPGFRKDGGFRARPSGEGRGDSPDRRSPGGRPSGPFNRRRSTDDRPEGGSRGFGDRRGGSGSRPGGSFNRRKSTDDRAEGGSRGYGDRRGGGSGGRDFKKTGGSDFRKSGTGSYARPYKKRFEGGEGGDKRSFGTSRPAGDKDFKKRGNANYGRPFKRKFETGDKEEGRPRTGGFKKDDDSSSRSKPRFGQEERGRKPGGARFGSKPPRDKRSRDTDDREEGKTRSFVQAKVEQQRAIPESKGDKTEAASPAPDALIRLNKYIANSGVCSRREADELIKMGLITVNGTAITEMGYKVKATDDVRHEGKRLSAEKPVYILMNKPKGFITTTDDPQDRSTVMHIIGNAVKERVYPVGRLDRNTTGLLLITNDGDVADKLTHPSYNAKKIYKVELDRPITKNDLQAIQDGVQLEEGRAIVDDLAVVSDDKKTVGLEIHIGWNHVVRRIFEALNYQVMKLDRVVYAGLDKKDLKRGQWRFLTKEEIVRLKHFK
jgi:23S rRNA pseudouridine2605 synthase